MSDPTNANTPNQTAPGQADSGQGAAGPTEAGAAAPPKGGSSPIARVRAAGYLRPGFVAAVVVLVAGVIGLQSLIWAMGLVLVKKPIPLQRDLEQMSGEFGPYTLVRRHDKLPKAQEEVLGTTNYISWIFHDTRVDKEAPGGLIRLHIPYYTGQIDSVPHVPDRCFVAGGALPNLKEIKTAELASRGIRREGSSVTALTEAGTWVSLPADEVPITVVRFAHQDQPNQSYTVAYFFIANNDYVATPEGVRIKAFNPFDRYAYWAKVEVMPYGIADPERTREVVGDFLSYALPEVMMCLPDWEAVNRGSDDEPATAAMR